MKPATHLQADVQARTLVITRTFDAPRARVWEAWTNPEKIVQWWGPNGFTNTLHEMDVRAGGLWRHTMHGPDGTDYPNKVVYLEVEKPLRLVYSHGGECDASPCQFHVTVTFEETGTDKTTVTLCMLFETQEQRDETARKGATEGAEQTFARLAQLLAEDRG